jgi:hypothetical protein
MKQCEPGKFNPMISLPHLALVLDSPGVQPFFNGEDRQLKIKNQTTDN